MQKKIIIVISTLGLLLIPTSIIKGAEFLEPISELKENWQQRGIAAEAVYTGEFWKNTRGGLKREDTYLGNLDITLSLETERLNLWKNGRFFVYLLHSHGGEKLSVSILGDKQAASNIEAPRVTRVLELWYEHFFLEEQLSVLAGLHDYNSEFNVSDYGSLYINSSFGVMPTISSNSRASIFPLAAPGIRVKTKPAQNWEILLGVYDGDPGDPEQDHPFARSTFSPDQGAFIASEITLHFPTVKPGYLKAGYWHSTGQFDDVSEIDENETAVSHTGNYGGYVIVDKEIYQEQQAEQGLGLFFQFGAAPDHINEIDYYFGGGLNYQGLIPSRDKDEAGIAVAFASFSDRLIDARERNQAETALELTYKAVICENFSIQPDLQFIFNPGGNPQVNDALVAGLRFETIL